MVVSHNALVGNPDLDALAIQIADVQPDILLLQEAPSAALDRVLDELDGALSHLESAGLQHVLSRWPLHDRFETGTSTGGALVITATTPTGTVRVANLHLTAPITAERRTAQRTEFDGLPTWRSEESVDMLMGDFNAGASQPAFRRLVSNGYLNAHRHSGCGTGLTFTPIGGPPLYSLDHALVRETFHVESFEVLGTACSDHHAIAVRFRVR